MDSNTVHAITLSIMIIVIGIQQYHIHKLINKLMSRSYWEYERAIPKKKEKTTKVHIEDVSQNEDMSLLNDVRIF